MPYRLLRTGEAITAADERLDDDCETWRPMGRDLFTGAAYSPGLFVPIRRHVPAQPAATAPAPTRSEGGEHD